MSEPHQNFEAAPDELVGRVLAITGANGGLGRAVALAAARCGAEVVLIGRRVPQLEAVHAEIAQLKRAAASIAPLNLESALARDYDALAQAVGERFGRLDGLLHSAALLGTPAPVDHYDVPTWCRVLHVNLTAAFALTQVLLPWLRAAPDASVVFTTSAEGRIGRAFWGAYGVSKFALEGLSQMLAAELEGVSRVRVNALNPGPARTRLRRAAYPAEDFEQLPAPEQLVQPYLWLLGPASRGVTGRSLNGQ